MDEQQNVTSCRIESNFEVNNTLFPDYFDEDASNLVDIDDFKRIFDSVPIKVKDYDFLA